MRERERENLLFFVLRFRDYLFTTQLCRDAIVEVVLMDLCILLLFLRLLNFACCLGSDIAATTPKHGRKFITRGAEQTSAADYGNYLTTRKLIDEIFFWCFWTGNLEEENCFFGFTEEET